MKVIGLTGPTGGGKSTVASLAKSKGFFVIDCDKEARLATEKGSEGLKAVVSVFGNDILLKDGSLNRKKLAEKAFISEKETEKLNKTLLPFILEIIKTRIDEFRVKGAEKILLDAPTLYESGADALCDEIIAVLCDKEIRRERIISRDGLTDEQANTRLAASRTDNFYTEKTEHIIFNNGDAEEFLTKASALLDRLV